MTIDGGETICRGIDDDSCVFSHRIGGCVFRAYPSLGGHRYHGQIFGGHFLSLVDPCDPYHVVGVHPHLLCVAVLTVEYEKITR